MSEMNLSTAGRLMRSAVVLFLCFMGMTLRAQAPEDRTVTLDMTNVPLEQVLESIEEQTDYVFLNKDVDASQTVSIRVTSVPVRNALDALFADRGITYNIESGHIVISEARAASSTGNAGGQQPESNIISGTVIDSYGTPVIGAGVLIKGTTIGTSTDLDGKFSFELPEGMDGLPTKTPTSSIPSTVRWPVWSSMPLLPESAVHPRW